MIANRIERRIRLSGVLVLLALALEIAGLLWKHPLSFALLHILALAIFVAGIAIYLLSLLPSDDSPRA